MRAESSGRIRLRPHQNGLKLTKGLKVLGNGFAKRLVGSVVFPSEFGPTVKLRVANLLWRQRIAGRTREGFPSFGKGVVGEISEFDAEGQRTGLHNSLVIGVPRLIRLVGKGLDCFNNAWVKTRPKQVGGFQRGIFQSVVQPSGLQGNILILQAKSLKAVESRREFHNSANMINVRVSHLIGLSRMRCMRDRLRPIQLRGTASKQKGGFEMIPVRGSPF